jgi:hypothetical protein
VIKDQPISLYSFYSGFMGSYKLIHYNEECAAGFIVEEE